MSKMSTQDIIHLNIEREFKNTMHKDKHFHKSRTFNAIENNGWLFTIKELNKLHSEHRNGKTIKAAKMCFCFQCQRVYSTKKITRWVGIEELYPICPYCGIDALLPIKEEESAAYITALAKVLHIVYFNLLNLPPKHLKNKV